MIIPRIKYFASRDFVGLGEDAQTYLKSARRNYARNLIDARRAGDSNRVNELMQGKSKLSNDAGRVDRMFKDPEKVSEAKKMIKKEVGFDRYSNNLESGKVAEARISRIDNYKKDPLLKNKETRVARAEALKAERLAKQPAKASYVKPESVIKPAQKAAYVKPESVVKQPVVQPKAAYVKPESVVKQKAEKVVSNNSNRSKLVEELRAKKLMGQRLKTAGKVGLGVAGAAGLAYGAKKLYDRNKNNQGATKEFSNTKEKVRKGLEYTSTGLGIGTGLGLGTAGYYGLKATKKGLDGISAYEGKTIKGLLKNKEVKEAADLIKRSFKNGDVRFKGNGKKALNAAAGLAAASIVAGGASKLLGKNKDSKK